MQEMSYLQFRLPLPRAWKRLLGAEHGGTLIETALSISLLLIFMFGVIETSLALYSYHYISDAAREGTRYAMVRGSTWGTQCTSYSSAGCTASAQNIKDFVTNMGFPGISTSNMTVTPQCATTVGGTFTSTLTNCNAAGDVVQVQVQYSFPFNIPFLTGRTFSMSSTSEMVIAQ
jgi:Flp pilus assembly protein TadG